MPDLIIWILIFMIIAAVVSLWTDDLLSAVIAFGAVGFGSSLLFLLLSAPDLAITQIVVEVVTLVLLIRATIAVGIRTAGGSRDVFGVAAAGALVLILLVFAVQAVGVLPEFGDPVMERFADAPSLTYLGEGLRTTGSANIVMSVLMDFRAYDTLGEASVLFAAVLGALALLRKRGRQSKSPAEGAPADSSDRSDQSDLSDMSDKLKTEGHNE